MLTAVSLIHEKKNQLEKKDRPRHTCNSENRQFHGQGKNGPQCVAKGFPEMLREGTHPEGHTGLLVQQRRSRADVYREWWLHLRDCV